MRIVAWNIRQGGGSRIAGIIGALASHEPDVVVLTEFRLPVGRAIIDGLQTVGLPFTVIGEPVDAGNRIAVFSRTAVVACNGPFPEAPFKDRWLELSLSDGTIIAAVYGPMGSTKPAFWTGLLQGVERRKDAAFILLGDLNTGDNGCDREGVRFDCADQFVKLGALLPDAWRHLHGDRKEFSWFSWKRDRRGRNGFRIDHAFVTNRLLPRVRACRYSHEERETELSDHSMLTVDVL